MKAVGNGNLFARDAKSTFLEITGSRYDGMVRRLQKKKDAVPFTKDKFREHVFQALGWSYDGAIRCRYCRAVFTLEEVAADHAIPLSRGGSADLDNIDFPCKSCNDQKGSLKPNEFELLLLFLERNLPEGRQDVLSRLSKAVSLAASMRANLGVIGDLKKTGQWQATQKARREAKASTQLGKF